MGGRRGDEGDPGEGRPVQPEEALAHGNDPDTVRLIERGDAEETGKGAGGEEFVAARRVDHEREAAVGTVEGSRAPATGWVEDSAIRLLGAFYDLSGGKPGEEVPLGGDEASEGRGAAQEAGIDPASRAPSSATSR